MSNSTMSEEQLISELLSLDLSDGRIGFTHLDRRDVYLLLPIIKKYSLSKQIEARIDERREARNLAHLHRRNECRELDNILDQRLEALTTTTNRK